MLALLIGGAGAFVVVTAAGSKRTTSAYDRFAAATEPFDVMTQAICGDEGEPVSDACKDHWAMAPDVLRSLPEVSDVGLAQSYLVPIFKEDGSSIQPEEGQGDPCYTGSGEVDVIGSLDDRLGTTFMRRRFVEGRDADPRRADEVVLSLAAARDEGIDVGDRLSIVPVACEEEALEAEWPQPIDVTVVGLQLSPGELQPERGLYFQSVTVTPPLLQDLQRRLGGDELVAPVVQLDEDATEDEFVAAASRAGYPLEVLLSQSELAAPVRDGLRPDGFALGLLSVLGAAVALIVLSQAISRQLRAGAGDHEELRALGFTGRGLMQIGSLQVGVLGVAAGLVTVLAAVPLSTTMPIGRARTIEPDPGLNVDVAAVSLGALGVAVLTTGAGCLGAWWIARRAVIGSPARPPRFTRMLSSAGASPQAVCGARMAFERKRGPRAVPLVSGLGAAIVGIGAVVGVLVFSSSLDHLLATPRLVGWNWDGIVILEEPTTDDPRDIDEVLDEVRSVEGVAAVSYGTRFAQFDDPVIEGISGGGASELGAPLLVAFSDGPRAVGPTVLRGRAPGSEDEVLLTGALADELAMEVGDTVELHGRSFTDAHPDGVPTSTEVTVVGIGVLPLSDGSFERGLSMTFEGIRELAAHAQPDVMFVDLREDADLDAFFGGLAAIGLPQGEQGDVDVVELVDLDVRQADRVPAALGILMAVLAAGVLAHLVLTAVQAHGRDLATLQTLGMRPGQLRRVVTWQAGFLMLVAFAVAAFGGIVIGRGVWLYYAGRLGVVPEVAVPLLPLALALAGFAALAIVIAQLTHRRQRRRSPGAVLRTE